MQRSRVRPTQKSSHAASMLQYIRFQIFMACSLHFCSVRLAISESRHRLPALVHRPRPERGRSAPVPARPLQWEPPDNVLRDTTSHSTRCTSGFCCSSPVPGSDWLPLPWLTAAGVTLSPVCVPPYTVWVKNKAADSHPPTPLVRPLPRLVCGANSSRSSSYHVQPVGARQISAEWGIAPIFTQTLVHACCKMGASVVDWTAT